MYRKGFTLVEIMIVVAIIALLAAIAIPNLLRARHNANEAAAQATLKTISTACESYRAAQNVPQYPPADADLSTAVPPYLDGGIFAAAGRQGYTFAYLLGANTNLYLCTATPINIGTTGTRIFTIDQTGVLRSGGVAIQ